MARKIATAEKVDGTAEVLDMPDALEPLVEYCPVATGGVPASRA